MTAASELRPALQAVVDFLLAAEANVAVDDGLASAFLATYGPVVDDLAAAAGVAAGNAALVLGGTDTEMRFASNVSETAVIHLSAGIRDVLLALSWASWVLLDRLASATDRPVAAVLDDVVGGEAS